MSSFHFWEVAHSTRGTSVANFTPIVRALAAPLALGTAPAPLVVGIGMGTVGTLPTAKASRIDFFF